MHGPFLELGGSKLVELNYKIIMVPQISRENTLKSTRTKKKKKKKRLKTSKAVKTRNAHLDKFSPEKQMLTGKM